MLPIITTSMSGQPGLRAETKQGLENPESFGIEDFNAVLQQ